MNKQIRAQAIRETLRLLSLNASLSRDESHALGLVTYYAKDKTLLELAEKVVDVVSKTP